MTYKLTLDAQQDLLDIYIYGKLKWGEEKADTFIRSLYEHFKWLSDQPEVGRKRDGILEGSYSYTYEKYTTFYRIKKYMEIVAIIHGSKDIPKHFS